jgi:large subunit ribosomal protein L31
MQQGIHPKYEQMKATCSCGNVIAVGSTLGRDINLEVCSKCHPFYTGKQKIVDTAGRVDKFNQKFGRPQPQAAAEQAEAKSAEVKAEAKPAKAAAKRKTKDK